MPDVAHLTAFAIAALTIAAIPGPAMLYVLARTLGGGRQVGLRSDREPPLGVLGGAPGIADRALRQGAITELLNPKTALFFLTFLPQFCQPEHGPLLVQVVVLGTASVVLNTLADVVIVLSADRMRARLRRRPRLWRRQQLATGSILVGLGVYAAASGHRAD